MTRLFACSVSLQREATQSKVSAASEIEDLPERTEQDGCDRKKYARELEEMIVASARQLLKDEPTQTLEPTAPSGRGSS